MKVPRSRRRPNIQWDTRKRQVLCCLFRFFCRDNKKWEEIFSHMFRSHLLERGITGFIPFTTLNIQWVNMREHGDSIWHRVHIATDFRKDGEWQDIISSIHSTAQLLHLQIQEKDSDSVDISRWRHPATALTMRNRQVPAPAVPDDPPDSLASAPVTNRLMAFAWHGNQDQETSPYFGDCEDEPDTEASAIAHEDESEQRQPGSSQPVVTSHGKVCLWCEQWGPLVDEQADASESAQAMIHDLEGNYDMHKDKNSSGRTRRDQQQDRSQSHPSEHGRSSSGDVSMESPTRVPTRELFDLTVEDENASVQSALQHEWPSDDEYPDTPTPCQRRHTRVSEEENTHQGHTNANEVAQIQLLFPDGSWKNGHMNK